MRTAPRAPAQPHHVMKEVKPILTENLRLGKPMSNTLQFTGTQQTGQSVVRLRTFVPRRVVHGLGRSMGWVGFGRVVLMFIFKVVVILQHKKCILLLYSPD